LDVHGPWLTSPSPRLFLRGTVSTRPWHICRRETNLKGIRKPFWHLPQGFACIHHAFLLCCHVAVCLLCTCGLLAVWPCACCVCVAGHDRVAVWPCDRGHVPAVHVDRVSVRAVRPWPCANCARWPCGPCARVPVPLWLALCPCASVAAVLVWLAMAVRPCGRGRVSIVHVGNVAAWPCVREPPVHVLPTC